MTLDTQRAYKTYAKIFVSRYKDEPTIMAWEVANMPRRLGSSGHVPEAVLIFSRLWGFNSPLVSPAAPARMRQFYNGSWKCRPS